ncbi:MAG TPA: holo-ACP synthase [Bacillota bacterium]|nr:holo-ACP synthase [Bacillota bacterium]
MIKGIGIDIIELTRIEKSIQKNKRIVKRVLTEGEQEVYETFTSDRRKIEFLAGRFAAKEAFAKANGTGIGELSFQHIEILADENGAPKLSVKGYDPTKLFISISHSDTFAIAQVIISH